MSRRMTHTLWLLLTFGVPLAGMAFAYQPAEPLTVSASVRSLIPEVEPAYAELVIPPLPAPVELDEGKVALGRDLFHDPRLSRDGTISCASCHDLARGGADPRSRSLGVGGAEGKRNSPTVYNSIFNFRQFWDGRSESLWDQVDGPIHDPGEMDMTYEEIVTRLEEDSITRERFVDLYGAGPTADSIRDAIVTFEASLVTLNSPFDRYLRGESDALSAEAKRGYDLFRELSCVACHQGVNIGGNLFQRMGRVEAFFDPESEGADIGRFAVTGSPSDRYKFKVPSLRNVAITAPYFHDGSVPTLRIAVKLMARHQLGYDISEEQLNAIVAFLESLTGEIPESARFGPRKKR